MMHGMSINVAPATLTLADLYPGAAREMMIQTTNEKTTAAVPAASTGTASAATSVISGMTGLPPVIVWLMLLVGVLLVGKVITEKVAG